MARITKTNFKINRTTTRKITRTSTKITKGLTPIKANNSTKIPKVVGTTSLPKANTPKKKMKLTRKKK